MSSIASARVLVFLLLSVATAVPLRAQDDPDPLRFEDEIRSFSEWNARNSFPRDAVLFVGSSSIRFWRTAEAFPKLPVINRGFGGSHISDVNHYIEETVLRYRPRRIVFYAGDNDVWDGKEPEAVRKDFEEFLSMVFAERPDTQVLYLSIKPSRSRWAAWGRMSTANELVASMAADSDRLTYVDITGATMAADALPDSTLFMPDQLHLNETGYERWESVLRPFLLAGD